MASKEFKKPANPAKRFVLGKAPKPQVVMTKRKNLDASSPS
jgi:hypothetical protein